MAFEAARTSTGRYGRYELLFSIAAGGMAEVFVARISGEGGFQKLVALKRMHRHLAEDDQFERMFLDEARLSSLINSPHVVPTLELGRTDDEELYLVMELVVGLSLSQLLRAMRKAGEPFDADVALEILAQAATGLDDAHRATEPDGTPLGIVHRDVSPQNILVGVDGRARISDFGVARALQRLAHTSGAAPKGKFSYFSPEQARSKTLDARSDVFALGVVAWETLAGRRLFASDSPLETMRLLVDEPAPDLVAERGEIARDVADAVHCALQKDPGDRFQSAAAMARALREAATNTPSRDELATFIDRAGGLRLEKLRDRIREVASVTDAELADDAAPMSQQTRKMAAGVNTHPLGAPPDEPEPETLGTKSHASVSTPARPRDASGWRWVAAAIVATVGLVGAFWLSRGDEPEESSAPAASEVATAEPPSSEVPAKTAAGVVPIPSASASADAAPQRSTAGKRPVRRAALPARAPDPTATAPASARPPASAATGPRTSPLLGLDDYDKHGQPKPAPR